MLMKYGKKMNSMSRPHPSSMSVTAGVPDAGFHTSIDSCTTDVVCPTNELGHMFYYNLSGSLFDDLTGTHFVGDVILTDVQNSYWSGTEYDSSSAWLFGFYDGLDDFPNKADVNHGWAVRAGDVGAVPIPAAVWLFGSGLIGLVGLARRKR